LDEFNGKLGKGAVVHVATLLTIALFLELAHCFGRNAMEVQEARNTHWQNLPLEIQDLIFCRTVQCPDEGVWLLMEIVLCFVCKLWKERKPFWQLTPNPSKASSNGNRSLDAPAAFLGSTSLLK